MTEPEAAASAPDLSAHRDQQGGVVLLAGFTRHYISDTDALRLAASLIEAAGELPEGPTNPKTQLADLDRLLELTVAARNAEHSPMWKSRSDKAVDLHGEACDALWNELDRQVACRRGAGHPVKPIAPKPDDAARAMRRLKRDLLTRLMEELPGAVSSILDDMRDAQEDE